MVEVEAATASGLPRTVLVGLPDAALHEAKERCRAAVAAAGLTWPTQVLTINLTPAFLPKAGTHFDLSIAAATLAAVGVVPATLLPGTVLLGELGLDGRVRPVRGVLPALLAAREAGMARAVVPASQRREAELVDGVTVWPVAHLRDVVEVLHGRPVLAVEDEAVQESPDSPRPDLAEVVGQSEARFALEVAAAGRHHLLLRGAPGCGKSMLAQRLPSILPRLDRDEALEVTALHSLAGQGAIGRLIEVPPLSQPHHSVSMAAMVGGGARIARPGAISLAHRGVLLLDEAPEFSSRVLDALRGPLENGWVVLGRSQAQTRYRARFQLVCTLNPCPCGMLDAPGGGCTCSPAAVVRYASRLSGPILDRVDVHQTMRPLTTAHLLGRSASPPESSEVVAQRVGQARARAARRWAGTPWRVNADVPGSRVRASVRDRGALAVVEEAMATGRLSARGVDKVLRLAWTLADLAGIDEVGPTQVHQALGLRRGEVR